MPRPGTSTKNPKLRTSVTSAGYFSRPAGFQLRLEEGKEFDILAVALGVGGVALGFGNVQRGFLERRRAAGRRWSNSARWTSRSA